MVGRSNQPVPPAVHIEGGSMFHFDVPGGCGRRGRENGRRCGDHSQALAIGLIAGGCRSADPAWADARKEGSSSV